LDKLGTPSGSLWVWEPPRHRSQSR
jgi:hypothetical protein